MSRQRYIKIWHDHSSISAHGHLLVLVSIIYDPAFFYTSEEMKNFKGVEIDVPTIVGKPEVYILGRSTSSTVDQLHFIATRRECLQDISILHTRTGTPVCDVRFFYGDGPAAQFEAGHKQGGTYCCTGCKADSCRFSEIAYCYRAAKHTLKERQEFLLQGKVWKKGGVNPMDGLKIHDLRTELRLRGLATANMKKPQLEKQFNELRGGIVNVPALLQGIPETPLSEIGLEQYEVSPVEPLHDIKGHLSNITDELRVSLNGETKTKVEAICSTVLGKETLRGSDYRKGSILILHTLQEFQPNSPLTTLFETAVEITEILYSDPSKHCPQSVLRLHNLAFIHAMLCRDQLSSPRTMSSRKLFGRYFHALTCHAPLLYRIISPRLLNTESEERMFGQCKSITRGTSNHHANHVITNILVRIHEEQKLHDVSNTIKKQGSEVQTLAGILHHKKNPQAWLHNKSIHYQAHLERIGDYLLQGQGKWWNYVEGGVEFYDIHTPNPLPSLPQIQHYRSTTLGDIESHLLMKWEQCSTEVELPAVHIRTYTCDGSVRNCVSSTHCTRQTPTLPPTPVNSISATTAPDAPLTSASATITPDAQLASASANHGT